MNGLNMPQRTERLAREQCGGANLLTGTVGATTMMRMLFTVCVARSGIHTPRGMPMASSHQNSPVYGPVDTLAGLRTLAFTFAFETVAAQDHLG